MKRRLGSNRQTEWTTGTYRFGTWAPEKSTIVFKVCKRCYVVKSYSIPGNYVRLVLLFKGTAVQPLLIVFSGYLCEVPKFQRQRWM